MQLNRRTVFNVILAIIGSISLNGCKPKSTHDVSCKQSQGIIGEFVDVPHNLSDNSSDLTSLQIKRFQILVHEVTNSEFAGFVSATGYVTDAELSLNAETDGAGSAVFGEHADENEKVWHLVKGATWRSPNGPEDNLEGKKYHPVTHVSHRDAHAYAVWAGGRLPTEAEWEHVASLGLTDKTNPLSGAFDNDGTPIANTWQGIFPIIDSADDGYKTTSPVGCFKPNELGIYDMIGNAWEWTDTPYADNTHVIKGGSYLCAKNFCQRYRPDARQFHESDFSTNHIGFRIVKDITD